VISIQTCYLLTELTNYQKKHFSLYSLKTFQREVDELMKLQQWHCLKTNERAGMRVLSLGLFKEVFSTNNAFNPTLANTVTK
jgi:hypothetical protein